MKGLKRILALAGVVILAGMVLLTLFFAVTGSRYFMASMLLTLTFPLLLYAYLFIYRLIKGDSEPKEPANKEDGTQMKRD